MMKITVRLFVIFALCLLLVIFFASCKKKGQENIADGGDNSSDSDIIYYGNTDGNDSDSSGNGSTDGNTVNIDDNGVIINNGEENSGNETKPEDGEKEFDYDDHNNWTKPFTD